MGLPRRRASIMPITTADEFIRLRTSDNPSEYLRAATDDAPAEVWREVIVRYPEMRRWIAHNKAVPTEILAILARDPSSDVRHSVARKNKLPAELMLELAGDENEAVRRAILYNKNAPIEVLRKLARDESADIAALARQRVAAAGAL
jgi:hypothetical protein